MDFNTIVIIAIIILLLAGLFYVSVKGKGINKAAKVQIYTILDSVEEKLRSNEPAILRDSLVKIDSALAKAFQLHYSNNQTLGVNLKSYKFKLDKEDYREVWKYHILRNKVVHENIDITAKDLNNAYKIYKKIIYKLIS